MYVEFCAQEGIPKEHTVKAWLYRHIFNDTCDDCDTFVIKYKNTTDDAEKNNIKALHNKHLEESSLWYSLKGFDKVAAIESHSAKKMLTVDLQKCLYTPYLTNGQSFYYRKLCPITSELWIQFPKKVDVLCGMRPSSVRFCDT